MYTIVDVADEEEIKAIDLQNILHTRRTIAKQSIWGVTREGVSVCTPHSPDSRGLMMNVYKQHQIFRFAAPYDVFHLVEIGMRFSSGPRAAI